MSRAYRVEWVTVESTVTAQDTLTMNLALLGILPPGEMAALLRDELARAGWTPTPQGGLAHAPEEGMVATLDPAATTVTVVAVEAGGVRTGGLGRDAANQALADLGESARAGLQRDAARRLTAAEPALREHLGEAVQRIYVEALRRKAASLGTVESVHESRGTDGEYELTIRVKT